MTRTASRSSSARAPRSRSRWQSPRATWRRPEAKTRGRSAAGRRRRFDSDVSDDADVSDVSLSASADDDSAISDHGRPAKTSNATKTQTPRPAALWCGVCGEGHAKDTLVPISLENKGEAPCETSETTRGVSGSLLSLQRTRDLCLAARLFHRLPRRPPPPARRPDRALVPVPGAVPRVPRGDVVGTRAHTHGRRNSGRDVPRHEHAFGGALERIHDAHTHETAPVISKRPRDARRRFLRRPPRTRATTTACRATHSASDARTATLTTLPRNKENAGPNMRTRRRARIVG